MTGPSDKSRDLVNRVFGDAIPEVSRAEREPIAPDAEDDHDQWLRDNVPPHHD
ncbi:hypothetical protein [Mycobacterium sp. 236(2023)]|uniref:hypothetical protein n=1 Tax=Mycobacterium sp. 236(2023) TaxID=3038163 RepID=UPI002414ECFB|nr:hypothetical protein [Mycobacterium sp. 236(2023)]MDG4665854.1 hypothetical protein [Mycobacterium sp. 236(2023)]